MSPGATTTIPEVRSRKHRLGLRFCSWETEPSAPKTCHPWAQEAHGGLGQCQELLPRAPASLGSESPQEKHSPPTEPVRQSWSYCACHGEVISSPSQEGCGARVSRETRCKWPPLASVGAPSLTTPPPTLAAPSGWLLPPPEPPERSVGLPAIVTDDEKGAQPAPPQRGPHLSAPCPHPRRPQLLVGEGGRGGGGRAQHLCAERGRPARGRAAAPHPRARRKERGWRQD